MAVSIRTQAAPVEDCAVVRWGWGEEGGGGRETFEVVSSAVWSRVLEWMVMSWASFWLAWSAVSVKEYMPRTPRGRVETKRLSL